MKSKFSLRRRSQNNSFLLFHQVSLCVQFPMSSSLNQICTVALHTLAASSYLMFLSIPSSNADILGAQFYVSFH